VTPRKFTMREALAILGVEPPKVAKDWTQADVDRVLAEWKEGALKDQLRALQKQWHPDRPGGSGEKFKELTTAYEEIRDYLKLRPKVQPASKCTSCSTPRIPVDARHCTSCGHGFPVEIPRSACPACTASRIPERAAFCHECGYDYREPDPLMERLRAAGLDEQQIRDLVASGGLDRLRKLSPFDPNFQKEALGAVFFAKMRRIPT
jgi:hypothetical protein